MEKKALITKINRPLNISGTSDVSAVHSLVDGILPFDKQCKWLEYKNIMEKIDHVLLVINICTVEEDCDRQLTPVGGTSIQH